LAPRIGKIYRCPVCKLELTLDTDGTHLVLAPLERNDVDGTKPRNQKEPRPRQPHRRSS
jgi:hypothetical protein